VIGRDGQLAFELARAKWPNNWAVTFAAPPELDLRFPDDVTAAVLAAEPDIVVNAAGYTDVELADSEVDLARAINATRPAAAAAACATIGAPFISISTDYVFDGKKAGAYTENDPVDPINAYGRSKAEGEALIRAALSQHVILRTSWLFSSYGTNFVKTMMRVGSERPIVRVVADQHGRPTSAKDLGRAIISVCAALKSDNGKYGTYHFANSGETTWHGMATAIFEGLAARGERVPQQVAAITTAEYPTKAMRPINSVLDCARLTKTFGITLRPWQDALTECLTELVSRKHGAAI
jgi:dTDP-4-dehydrorhamnose reductase